MNLIMTDDAGAQAARKACRTTSEITEIDVKTGEASLLVLRVPSGLYAETLDMTQAEALLEKLVPSREARARIAFVAVPEEQSLEHLPQAAMLRLGWKRVR